MNVNKYSEEELKYFFESNSVCVNNKKIYFSAQNYDALVYIDIENFSCGIESHFFDAQTTTYCAHAKTILYKDYIFCIPRYSRYIIKYDLNTKITHKIVIPNLKDNKSVFSEAVLVGDRILCFPEFFTWIISINVETDEISYIENISNKAKDTYIFTSNAVIRWNEILIPFYATNQLLILDTDSNNISFIDLPIKAKGCAHIACTDKILCLIGTDNVCYIANNSGEILAECENCNGVLFTVDNTIWLVNEEQQQIYTINEDSLVLEEYTIKSSDFVISPNSKWIKSTIMNGYISILMQRENSEIGLFMCNEKEERYEVISIDNFYKAFFKDKSIFQEHEGTKLPLIDIVKNSKISKVNDIENIGLAIYNEIEKGDASEKNFFPI